MADKGDELAPKTKDGAGNASAPASAPAISDTLSFYLDDFPKTLFPLKTNRELITRGKSEVEAYILKCLDDTQVAHSFLPQQRVYAAKPNRHLRRTLKLDIVAEYYIYDIVYRNKSLFKKPHTTGRTHYGYRFENGAPISPTIAYKNFKGAIADYSKLHPHSMSFDVASYFNHIYHHDIVSWFSELGASSSDAEGLGQLLRQTKSGRSLDCLPQGLYPTKMIGNDFLRFVDNYFELESDKLVRFMDDFHLFSDNRSNIENDFQIIQKLLGEKGLSINPQKTKRDETAREHIGKEIDEIKKKLLERRRLLLTVGYDDAGEEILKEHLFKFPLNDNELKYIDSILEKPEIEEDDAELILTIMRDNTTKVEKRLPYIVEKYPHLAKNVHSFCASLPDKDVVANIILNEARSGNRLMEFQLFWFSAMLDDYLISTKHASALIKVLYNHRSATTITRAKILEIADNRFGLQEIRSEHLSSGQSNWPAWASAVGSRSLKPISKNHALKYFGNSSEMNHLIASIMQR